MEQVDFCLGLQVDFETFVGVAVVLASGLSRGQLWLRLPALTLFELHQFAVDKPCHEVTCLLHEVWL